MAHNVHVQVRLCSSKSTDAMAAWVIGDNENNPAEVAGGAGVEIGALPLCELHKSGLMN